MPTFDLLQAGVATSRPVELFEFGAGATTFRYSGAEDDITLNGETFTAVPISRKAVQRSADSRLSLLTVSIPGDDPIVELYSPNPVPFQLTAKITRIERDETPAPTGRVVFVGFVKTIGFSENGRRADLGLISLDSFLVRTLPRFTYQSVCNHQLYDSFCRATAQDHTFVGSCTAVVESASGTRITVTGLGASGFVFRGGMASIQGSGDPRMVIAQGSLVTSDEDEVTILRRFNSDPVGRTIELVEGCDHLLNGDCGQKFDVVQNFGGFAWVPTKNFFATGLF